MPLNCLLLRQDWCCWYWHLCAARSPIQLCHALPCHCHSHIEPRQSFIRSCTDRPQQAVPRNAWQGLHAACMSVIKCRVSQAKYSLTLKLKNSAFCIRKPLPYHLGVELPQTVTCDMGSFMSKPFSSGMLISLSSCHSDWHIAVCELLMSIGTTRRGLNYVQQELLLDCIACQPY